MTVTLCVRRCQHLGNYIIAYDIDEAAKTVHVLMITQGHRMWQELFKKRK